MLNVIRPNWPAPNHIQAFSTTRQHGFSTACYESLNLASHVGDDENHVIQNRKKLANSLNLSAEPLWLNQVHSNEIIAAAEYKTNISADGCYTTTSQQICTIMTADCLPILLTNTAGTFVMALHAGWRGLANGIIEQGIARAEKFGKEILVWLGPAISQPYYEVGPEVKSIFTQQHLDAQHAFKKSNDDRWLLDIYFIATQKFTRLGINNIYHSQFCTYENDKLFFSYRREGKTGRMTTGIYIV